MININGKTYYGNNISISGNKIIIDDKDVSKEHDSKEITVHIDGNVDNVSIEYCKSISINGDVGNIKTSSGDIECNDVKGNITTTSGDIECGNVGGNVETTSGDVKSENINGSVRTLSGDIKHKKQKV